MYLNLSVMRLEMYHGDDQYCSMDQYGLQGSFLNDSQTGLEIDNLSKWEFFEKLCNMIAYGDIMKNLISLIVLVFLFSAQTVFQLI